MKKINISKEWNFSSPEFSPVLVDLPHDYSIKQKGQTPLAFGHIL